MKAFVDMGSVAAHRDLRPMIVSRWIKEDRWESVAVMAADCTLQGEGEQRRWDSLEHMEDRTDAVPGLKLELEWNGSIGSVDGGIVVRDQQKLRVVFVGLDAVAYTGQELEGVLRHHWDRSYRVSDGDTAPGGIGDAEQD